MGTRHFWRAPSYGFIGPGPGIRFKQLVCFVGLVILTGFSIVSLFDDFDALWAFERGFPLVG